MSPPILRPQRYESLDAWRGVACLSVLVFHSAGVPLWGTGFFASILSSGWIGVPIFFVVSGYCISAAVERTRLNGTPFFHYMGRRLMRIFPPYWMALLVIVSTMLAFSAAGYGEVFSHSYDNAPELRNPLAVNVWQWLGSVFLVEGWRAHFIWRGGPGWFMPIAWSLGYEEQFYLVTGVLMLLARSRWLRLAGVVTLLVVVSVLAVPIEGIRGFWFDGRWLLFAYGIGVYACIHRPGMSRVPFWLTVIVGIAWSVSQPGFGPQAFVTEVAAAAVVAALFVVLFPFDQVLTRSAMLRPLRWCGLRCYSIYLLHWPLSKAAFWCAWMLGLREWYELIPASVGLALISSLLAAAAFYRLVEVPCIGWHPRVAAAPSPAMTATV